MGGVWKHFPASSKKLRNSNFDQVCLFWYVLTGRRLGEGLFSELQSWTEQQPASIIEVIAYKISSSWSSRATYARCFNED